MCLSGLPWLCLVPPTQASPLHTHTHTSKDKLSDLSVKVLERVVRERREMDGRLVSSFLSEEIRAGSVFC